MVGCGVIITLRRRKQERVQYEVQFAESTLTSVMELQIYTPYCGLAACLPAHHGNQANLTKILPRLDNVHPTSLQSVKQARIITTGPNRCLLRRERIRASGVWSLHKRSGPRSSIGQIKSHVLIKSRWK